MNKKQYEEILNILSSTGSDFSEIFYEDEISKTYIMTNSILDDIAIKTKKGIGFRILKDGDVYYSSSNDLAYFNLKKIAENLSLNLEEKTNKKISLKKLKIEKQNIKIKHSEMTDERKKDLLKSLDQKIRSYSKYISQVSLYFVENDRNITIANSEEKFIQSESTLTRFICQIYTEKNGVKEKNFVDKAVGKGYEILDEIDLEKLCLESAKIAVEKLDAETFKGGKLPVILCPGFGAVIFHEACGHGLEATSVAPKLSVFTNDLNKKIANKKVTLIDDGTMEGYWGSNIIDDEGNYTNKNILIEKGILKNFLVDKVNSEKMNIKENGCGRRESYLYPPTSRMSNTYLLPGNDSIEDMIKSIDNGVYCEKMSGGSVNTSTGEFNFAVDSAFLIENGKMTKRIKGITLIGTSKEILKNVEMVSDDLVISGGYCGSKSGMIPVTIGQPTIKVSEILVGGME